VAARRQPGRHPDSSGQIVSSDGRARGERARPERLISKKHAKRKTQNSRTKSPRNRSQLLSIYFFRQPFSQGINEIIEIFKSSAQIPCATPPRSQSHPALFPSRCRVTSYVGGVRFTEKMGSCRMVAPPPTFHVAMVRSSEQVTARRSPPGSKATDQQGHTLVHF
jgi:hypothetical protein